jgi:serine/threonine protein kinase
MNGLALPDALEAIGRFKIPNVTLEDFELERLENGHVKIFGAGMNAFLIVGKLKEGRHVNDPFLTVGRRIALRYLLTFRMEVNRESSRAIAHRLVSEMTLMASVLASEAPGHPLVASKAWFTTPQDPLILGMYFNFQTRGSLSQLPMDMPDELYDDRAVVVISELYPYVLCDYRCEARSFVHQFPREAADNLDSIFSQIRRGVEMLQRHNMSHNDIKCDNVVVDVDEVPGRPMQCRAALIDFGEVTQFADQTMTLPLGQDRPGGSPAYKLPSLHAGQRCFKDADFYALRCMQADLTREILRQLQRVYSDEATAMKAERCTAEEQNQNLTNEIGRLQEEVNQLRIEQRAKDAAEQQRRDESEELISGLVTRLHKQSAEIKGLLAQLHQQDPRSLVSSFLPSRLTQPPASAASAPRKASVPGTCIGCIGTGLPGTANNQLHGPHGISAFPDGTIVIAEMHNHRVKLVQIGGSFLRHIGTGQVGSGIDQFNHPHGVAALPENRIAVADMRNHRVCVWSREGAFLWQIGTGSIGAGQDQFNCPRAVAALADGTIAVSDMNNHRVKIVTVDGRFVRQIGSGKIGAGNDDFNGPYGLCGLSDGSIAVADFWNHRVKIVASDGSFLRHIGTGVPGSGNDEFNYPIDVASLPGGDIAVADKDNHRVKIVKADGTFIRQLRSCLTLAGKEPRELRSPFGVAALPDGTLAVAEFSKNQVAVLDM